MTIELARWPQLLDCVCVWRPLRTLGHSRCHWDPWAEPGAA